MTVLSDLAMDAPAKLSCFHHLARAMNLDPVAARRAVAAYAAVLSRQGIQSAKADLPVFAAHYLRNAKGHADMPHDPVARFHPGNGAIAHADRSEKGRAQSGGGMVNSLYDLRHTAQRNEEGASAGLIAASSAVKSLAAQTRLKGT